MKEAIEKAIERGWKISVIEPEYYTVNGFAIITGVKKGEETVQKNFWPMHRVLLDPLFWQALGEAMMWNGDGPLGTTFEIGNNRGPAWRNAWHRFIDHLAEGKDVDSFFNELLK